jgi:hypothetical protein
VIASLQFISPSAAAPKVSVSVPNDLEQARKEKEVELLHYSPDFCLTLLHFFFAFSNQ